MMVWWVIPAHCAEIRVGTGVRKFGADSVRGAPQNGHSGTGSGAVATKNSPRIE